MSLVQYPVLLYYITEQPFEDKACPAQAAFTVSSKKFKRATDRNRIKRLMREAYRLQKRSFYQSVEKPLQYKLVFVYIGKEIENYSRIENSIHRILGKLVTS